MHVRTVWIADESKNRSFSVFPDARAYAASLHAAGIPCVIRSTDETERLKETPRSAPIIATGAQCARGSVSLRIVG